MKVMEVVKRVAETGRAVICTIHQPSLTVFSYFDHLLLLKRGGRTVYFGPTGTDCSSVLEYFSGIGYFYFHFSFNRIDSNNLIDGNVVRRETQQISFLMQLPSHSRTKSSSSKASKTLRLLLLPLLSRRKWNPTSTKSQLVLPLPSSTNNMPLVLEDK